MIGYKGKLLKINLTTGEAHNEEIPKEWYHKYIGGEGFVTKILYDNIKPGIDPLGEDNLIVLATGPLTGTHAPSSGRLCIGFKSPLTGGIGLSNVGGHLAPMIKKAGYDAIMVFGASETPVYIDINDGDVKIRDAKKIWGMNTIETEKAIREELGNEDVRIAEIGPAGEKLSNISTIMVDSHRAAGRGGPGAVMGSKNLKAIACFGSGDIEIADKENMMAYARKAAKELREEAFVRDLLIPFGTPTFTDAVNSLGMLPTKNWQKTTFDVMDKLGYEAYHETLDVKSWACHGCFMGCGRDTKIKEGTYAGEKGGGPEFETIGALGSKCYIDDLESIAMAGYICDKMGLDTISTGQTIATAMEWFEKGIIDKETTGGIDLSFGNADDMVEMVEQIAERKGFGKLLGEGSYRAAEELGEDAMYYVMHVKKMEMASCGVRASKGEALSHMISARGADHLRPFASVVEAMGYTDKELGINEKQSPFDNTGKYWVKPFMELSMMTNLLGVCLFASITLAVKGESWTGLYNAATASDLSFEEMMKCSERVLNLERLFNQREGFDKKDDTLPLRLLQEPAADGIGKGQTIEIEGMLKEFYEDMGWDLETGRPTEKRLKELDLV